MFSETIFLGREAIALHESTDKIPNMLLLRRNFYGFVSMWGLFCCIPDVESVLSDYVMRLWVVVYRQASVWRRKCVVYRRVFFRM